MDCCNEQKSENTKLSQRYFSQKLGSKSPSFYKDVIEGRKNISSNNIINAIQLLKLSCEEEMFFENLVLFNQSKTIESKNRYFKRMVSNKKVTMDTINKDSYEFFSKWYYSAMRELIYYFPFSGNHRDIAKQLIPAIKESEAKEGIDLLKRMGYITQTSDGAYKLISNTLTTGNEVQQALEIATFQSEMISLSKDALDMFPMHKRDISSLTLSLSQKAFKQIKISIQDFRKDILKIASEDTHEDTVYQFNFQLFPLTKTSTPSLQKEKYNA